MINFNCYLTDTHAGGYDKHDAFFQSADTWAQESCPSYIGYHVQDVSDFSGNCDVVACFTFRDPSDAAFFKLRWE